MRLFVGVFLAVLLGIGCENNTREFEEAGLLPETSAESDAYLCGRNTLPLRSTELTKQTFVPEGKAIFETRACAFAVGDTTATLTAVLYGAKSTDAPGTVCAFVDQDAIKLFNAVWYAADDTPATLKELCPSFPAGATAAVPACDLPGASHPVTATAEFKALARRIIGNGKFIDCFQGYAGRFTE